MTKRLFVAALVLAIGGLQFAMAQSNGNPRPGWPHDTLIIHVQKASSGPKNCDGGHSLFLRYDSTGHIIPANLFITMIDYVADDDDNDGLLDDEPLGTDTDGDGILGEDPIEIGGITRALDCDGLDGRVELQIRDANGAPGIVSTQEWFIRLVGKPEQLFSFNTYANQVCTAVDPDTIPNSGDEYVSCGGTKADWAFLASFNLVTGVNSVECVKQVKKGGGGTPAGGKTPFCDITDGFEVDVIYDTDGNGTLETFPDQFVFGVRTACLDDPTTPAIEESDSCPLSGVVWGDFETNEFSKAQAQIFVAHTGNVSIRTGKIVKP